MNLALWGGFLALVVALLALDLGVFHRKPHAITMREALGWSAFWISLGLLFMVFVYFGYREKWLGLGENLSGGTAAMQYLTGYLLEKSLSIDNIFVIALIFAQFEIPDRYQHRLLFWGILGALVFRGAMIAAGISALHAFEWTFYVFGAILVYTAARLFMRRNAPPKNIRESRLVRVVSRWFPFTSDIAGGKMIRRNEHGWVFTRMALVLVVIEATDVLFAVDSIPAVFAVTTEPFLVFTSNVFAILGLRSLYFALAGLIQKFEYVDYSLVVILGFVGVKMLVIQHIHIPTWISLTVIVVSLTVGVVASLVVATEDSPEQPSGDDGEDTA